jgi:hypothetical protein
MSASEISVEGERVTHKSCGRSHCFSGWEHDTPGKALSTCQLRAVTVRRFRCCGEGRLGILRRSGRHASWSRR